MSSNTRNAVIFEEGVEFQAIGSSRVKCLQTVCYSLYSMFFVFLLVVVMMMLTIILIRNTTIVITTDTGQHLSLLETFYLMEIIAPKKGFYITTGKTCHTVMHVTQILLVHKAPNEGIDCSVISMEFYLIR